jgi:predicted nuclease of predicted toxin-antitoxin system
VHFLVDASMPRGTAPLIRSGGHDATDVPDIGLGAAIDPDIAAHAQTNHLAILSRDFDFADVRHYPPDQFDGIAVIDLPCTATVPTILKLVEELLQQPQTLNHLPGRLAVVAPGRIRLWPKP